MPQITSKNRIALLMHGAVGKAQGKMGYGLMRYGVAPVVVVLDPEAAGKNLAELTGIPTDAPIVATLDSALAYAPDILVPAIAPDGGALPAEWLAEIGAGLDAGLSVVNGLHTLLGTEPQLSARVRKPGQFIWDIRQEPADLTTATDRARKLAAKRVLFVGTDMANGKMTAALEMDRAARASGLRAKFLATGQIGIAISGGGIPLDAVRVDFAAGSIEQMVVDAAAEHDLLFVEGQGSLLHPASTATLALIRGSAPTHMILSHRAWQTHLVRFDWVKIPPLADVIRLYEQVACAAGALSPATVAGIALNTGHLTKEEAAEAVREVQREVPDIPVTDVVRYGCAPLLDALL